MHALEVGLLLALKLISNLLHTMYMYVHVIDYNDDHLFYSESHHLSTEGSCGDPWNRLHVACNRKDSRSEREHRIYEDL